MASAWLPETKEQKLTARRKRLTDEHRARLETALAHYAGTEVPIERICRHLALDEKQVIFGLRRHGRMA